MDSTRRYREQLEQEAEEAKKTGKSRHQYDVQRATRGDIADPRSRYANAIAATYSIRDPYTSLADAAMHEYTSFRQIQDILRIKAAAEKDPQKRRVIDLRREIEGHDYMAITSERLAGISRAITVGDNASARRDDLMVKAHTGRAAEKRQERTDLQREIRQRETGRQQSHAPDRGGGRGGR